MPTLVLPSGGGAIPPTTSLVVLLRKCLGTQVLSFSSSLSLLVCSVTLVYQSFDCWASPGKVTLLLCHFWWNELGNRLFDRGWDVGQILLNRPVLGVWMETPITKWRHAGTKAFKIPFMKLIDSSRRFWGRLWSQIYFEENSVMVTDTWDEVTCLDEAANGRKSKI